MKAGYVIHVGHYAPQKAIISVPNKEGNPSVDVAEVYKTVGAHLLINRARVYARRVLTDGKPATDAKGDEQVLEVTDTRYRGKLEFLPWGSTKVGAQAIDLRYLAQSASLDVEYQDNIQKIKVDAEGKDGSAFLELEAGQNKFNYDTQALLIQFYQVHPQNRDSKSKNPDPKIKGFTYYEMTDALADTTSIAQSESRITAGNFVLGLSTKPESMRNLMDLFLNSKVEFGETNLLSIDKDIYKALLNLSEQKPGDFGKLINDFKKEISDNFEKAKAYKALDLTKAGTIGLIVGSKKEVIFENAEGKDDEMIDWVLENFLDAKVYNGVKKLKELCEKLN